MWQRRRSDLGKACEMTAFFVTIATTVAIYLLFAGFGRWGVQTSWAITLNYFVAAGLGWTLAGGVPAMGDALTAPWIWPLAALGLAFYPLFRLTAKCSQELGVSVATVATKLSMAIPVLVFALLDGWSGLGLGQWLGLALAFPAVWLSAMDGDAQTKDQGRWGMAWMPVVMFLGSGTIDTMFGWFTDDPSMEAPGMQMAFASVPFTLGGVVGLLDQFRSSTPHPKRKDILAGMMLGVVNFGSLYFLLRVFNGDLFQRSMVVPMLNLSVIVLATLVSVVAFKDIPGRKARWGVALAALAIGAMMTF